MDFHPHLTAAAQAIDSTREELSALGLGHLTHALADHTITPDDAHHQLQERRRVRALITGPVVYDVETHWTERGWLNLEWTNVTHGGAQGLIRSSENVLDAAPRTFYALLSFGGEDVEFTTVEEIENAMKVLTDLRDAARELPFDQHATEDQAAA
ncbi:MAG: hypothetical protein INR66_21305 [Gordonia polyisoprenivorans]|nr:hypothetical protein [Gordonia polyisoprenivorans]